MRELAERYRLPVWMTEFGGTEYGRWPDAIDWAVKMHRVLTVGGVSAVDYIFGFFGDWVGGGTLVAIQFDTGLYRGHSFTPAYYVTGQFSRFIRPGYRRVDVTPRGDEPVLVSAFKGSGRVVIVAVNTESRNNPLSISFARGKISGSVTRLRTSAAERWRTPPPVRASGSRFSTMLAAQSVTTFVVKGS